MSPAIPAQTGAATIDAVRSHLGGLASPEVARTSARFFKTGPGDYGEGDQFMGIRVPVLRQVARQFRDLEEGCLSELLESAVHEERLLSLLVLVHRVTRATPDIRQNVYRFYVRHLARVNNWDLVDTSAPAIVGGYLADKSRAPLYKWARSPSLWERRIAILATQYFIRQDDFDDTLELSRILLRDSHDLLHKAVGWMLREVGRRNDPLLRAFLTEHHGSMPRTMLRYAIERLPPTDRQAYLAGRTPGPPDKTR